VGHVVAGAEGGLGPNGGLVLVSVVGADKIAEDGGHGSAVDDDVVNAQLDDQAVFLGR
jgi:hypothetical protein